MPTFPGKRDEILILAAQIVAGIESDPAEFPNPPFDVGPLKALLMQTAADGADHQSKAAAAKAALDRLNGRVGEVKDEAKRLLRLAETVHKNEEPVLERIGWGVKSGPHWRAPGAVRGLTVGAQGAGTVVLRWKAPERVATVGRVRAYCVERETRTLDTRISIEEFGGWKEISFAKEIVLTDQPRGAEITYRVYALNDTGQGPPSESEPVVL